MFVMCRRDPNTKQRHVKRRHPESTLKNIEIYNFECHECELKEASQSYYLSSSNVKKISISQVLISTVEKKDLCVLKSTQNDDTQDQFQGTDTNRSKSEWVSSHFLGRAIETGGKGDGVSCLDGI